MESQTNSGCLIRAGQLYQTIAVLLLTTLFFLFALELSGRLLIPRLEQKGHQAQLQFQQQLTSTANSPWLADYWREHYLVQDEYHPYVIWRLAPFQGETINIDAEGFRVTPGAACEPDALTVFMFGGSTMWGYGVPDAATIPAHLQAKLSEEREGPVCVRNFGQKGFVSTQGVIELQGQLQQGNVPDVVIFYDGINEVGLPYQHGRVTHLAEDKIAHHLANEAEWIDWVQSTYSYQLATVAARKIAQWNGRPTTNSYEPGTDDLAGLADDIVMAYLANYRLVAGLSEQYGFDFYFIWQPYLITYTEELSPEQLLLVQGFPVAYAQFFRNVYRQVEEGSADYPHLYYRANALLPLQENVWIDPQHLNPTGNEQMSEVILQVIR